MTLEKKILRLIKTNSNISECCRNANISRQTFYNLIYRDFNPNFRTVCNILKSMGYRLTLEKLDEDQIEGPKTSNLKAG